jgi:hypothetical protein
MSIDLAAILKLIEEGIALEKKIEAAIASEKDLKRRAILQKAYLDRDTAPIKELLYGTPA